MGSLRAFLALSVVLVHSGPLLGLRGVPGDVALQAFFMMSGFYMALVLSTKYVGPGALRRFAWNRLLRLLPIYWVTALATVAFLGFVARHPFDCGEAWARAHCFVDYAFFERYSNLEPGPLLYLVASNLTLFGQDVALFMAFDDQVASLSFTSDFTRSAVPVYSLLLVPQAWSLSVELLFYLVVPLLVPRSAAAVVLVVLASLLLRYGIYSVVGAHDPWTYRFFPTELALFALGVLACKAYLRYVRDMPVPVPAVVTGLFLGLSVAYPWLRLPGDKWTYFAIAAVALPFLFRATRDSKVDSIIGDLSYPIYVVHILVIAMVIPLIAGTEWESRLSWIAVPASVLAAAALWLLVGKPIETWRHGRPVRSAAVS